MASRFHQREARSALFSGYDQSRSPRPTSSSPAPTTQQQNQQNQQHQQHQQQQQTYGYTPSSSSTFAAYPGGSTSNNSNNDHRSASANSFRSATPNARGQYSDAVLSGLESQNDEQVSEMSRKVAMLKDITSKIGDEIRDSTALAEKMNDQFSNTSQRLKGTMNRMLRMAESTGVGWKVWLGFFAAVVLLFWWVWL